MEKDDVQEMFIEYDSLNDNDKRIVRDILQVNRVSNYYFEDNNIILMNSENLFQYIYLDEIKRIKDAISLINDIINREIKSEDIFKTVKKKILESHDKVTKISDDIYMYKDN